MARERGAVVACSCHCPNDKKAIDTCRCRSWMANSPPAALISSAVDRRYLAGQVVWALLACCNYATYGVHDCLPTTDRTAFLSRSKDHANNAHNVSRHLSRPSSTSRTGIFTRLAKQPHSHTIIAPSSAGATTHQCHPQTSGAAMHTCLPLTTVRPSRLHPSLGIRLMPSTARNAFRLSTVLRILYFPVRLPSPSLTRQPVTPPGA
ncbi:hypothetical protein BDW02DRAFT_46829 [Decorospora gaudefroyi]|uniref:Uncharacterized protein n=1 Tax=Decorospora gaudefroyi TaxID=184978 RepID=A0A6A5K3A3_9PLEO|nr:hypothetical protein BDW02DRAFT_46829 [Decorospora gaudefroyi]